MEEKGTLLCLLSDLVIVVTITTVGEYLLWIDQFVQWIGQRLHASIQ